MRKAGKAVTAKLDKLKNIVFVRHSLNKELVDTLTHAFEAGEIVPPIWVAKNGVIIDGRHRVEAAKAAGKSELPAISFTVNTESEIIRMAAEANGQGPMPLVNKDYSHILRHYQDQGWPVTKIHKEILPNVSLIRLRRLVREGTGVRNAHKYLMLRSRVAAGEDISQAALKVGLSPEEAVESLGTISRSFLAAVAHASRSHAVASAQVARMVNEWTEEYQHGKIEGSQLEQLMEKIMTSANKHLSKVHDLQSRVAFVIANRPVYRTRKLRTKIKNHRRRALKTLSISAKMPRGTQVTRGRAA